MKRAILIGIVALLVGLAPFAASAVQLHSQTHAVDSNTSHVFIEITDSTWNGTTENVTADFYGIESDGTETLVESVNISAGNNETVKYLVAVNASKYSDYRVEGHGNDTESIRSGVHLYLTDKTVAIDNDTTSVTAEYKNTTGNLTAEFYGVKSDGDEFIQETKHGLNAGVNETLTYEHAVDAEMFVEYRVVITGEGAEWTDAYAIGKLSGGGGGLLGGSSFLGIPLVGWVILLLAGVLLMEDGGG